MPDTIALSRRRFLKTVTGASTLVALPYFIPASVLGKNGEVPPSEKILVGGIGIQSRGMHDLGWIMNQPEVQFVAICDLQKKQRLAVKNVVDKRYGTRDCAMYPEIKGFLAERPDIDAVLIATGDRWHAMASILAMRAGKDVYTEKPSCMTIAEGRAVVETARRYGRVYQTGTQRLSEAHHVFCIEMARTGRLGKIHTAYAHIAPWDAAEMRHDWLPAVAEPSKDEVDWDAWLGSCPWRPYNPAYVAGDWRGHYDFHTSCIGEWGAHTFAQAQAGLGCSESSPVEYEYVANKTGDGMVTHFASGVRMILSRESKYWHGSCGERFDGTEGWAAAADGYAKPDVSSPALLGEYERVVGEYVARTGRSLDHMQNFIECVKCRQRTVANPEVMHHSMTTVHAANICMWLKRSLKFDSVKEEFVGDEEANRLRSRAMREPYIY
jgi:hypothetical protein